MATTNFWNAFGLLAQDGSMPWQQGCAEIARRVVAGRVDPNDACTLLAEVSNSIAGAKELMPFELLAHEQYGHEHLGMTAESCASEIVDECRHLASLDGG